MMHEVEEPEAARICPTKRVSAREVSVLFALAGRPDTYEGLLCTSGMTSSEFLKLHDGLRADGLIDGGSEVGEGRAQVMLRLTDQGERVLLREMEHVYELPE